jgi:hypothetical protein
MPILMVPAAALARPCRTRSVSRRLAAAVALLVVLVSLLGAVTDGAAAQDPAASESTEAGTRPDQASAPVRGDAAVEVHAVAPADVPDASWRRTRIERDEGPPVSPLSQRSPRPRRGPPAA